MPFVSVPLGDALPPIDSQRGGDPDLLRDELRAIIGDAILTAPRSLQVEIGPSALGTPCERKLGYQLANTPLPKPTRPAWRPTVGTAVHAWLRDVLEAANITSGVTRWLAEYRVDVGYVGEELISGHVDLYDRMTATVIDWKVCGQASLKLYRATGPGPQYRTQGHLYGRGWERRDLPVDTIAWLFLPMAGELTDSVWYAEPYDESLAVQALQRATRIRTAQDAVGPDLVNAALPTAPDHCVYCPWHIPLDGTALGKHCPGHSLLGTMRKDAD